MINLLHTWKGSIEINGTEFQNITEASNFNFKNISGDIHIVLKPTIKKAENEADRQQISVSKEDTQYKIKVRQYMTKKSSPAFDFMQKWNNDIPMPMRVMVGKKLQETRGMVKMELHGDIVTEITPCCMCCGRPITNRISQYFGMGPECGNHNYVNPFDSEAELRNAVREYREQLHNITWTGWIIKSAIEEEEEV